MPVKRCCPTCKQPLPVEVLDLWGRVQLAGHHFRCICAWCRGDIAEIVRLAGEAKEALGRLQRFDPAAFNRPKKTRKRKPRRPRPADYDSINAVVAALKEASRNSEGWEKMMRENGTTTNEGNEQ